MRPSGVRPPSKANPTGPVNNFAGLTFAPEPNPISLCARGLMKERRRRLAHSCSHVEPCTPSGRHTPGTTYAAAGYEESFGVERE